MNKAVPTSSDANVALCAQTTALDLLCVHEMFELQARRTPKAVALMHGERGMTYAELDDRTDLLAHYLRAQGVGPDERVLVCMDRGFSMICAVIAILKAGGAYVPIDPTFPASRLKSMIGQSGASLMMTTTAVSPAPSFPDVFTVNIDRDWDELIEFVEVEPFESAKTDNLAYVMFTSGSTGEPKGVAMPHRALSNLIAWQIEQSSLQLGARTVQFASLSFDVSFQEIFSTICAGGTLILIDEDVRRDPSTLLKLASIEQVDRLYLPYVALKQLADAAQYAAIVPASLREVITAGEQLQVTPSLVSFFKKLPKCRLRNQYGPSETHVVTQYTLSDSPGEWPALPPIGAPIPGAKMIVLDADLKAVPRGEIGELYVAGICTARGYLSKPELTAERFIPNPIGEHPEDRLYRTGDLVKVNGADQLEFVGRADDQLKIRGYRVEPAEIEQVLASHPCVAQAAVVARGGNADEQRLTAFIVPRPGTVPEVGNIYRFLETKLPVYMVPTEFVPLESLPTTPSGKLDRLALSREQHAAVFRRAHYAPPHRQIEQQIAALWSELLGVDRPSLFDNFFDLGGTSILAVKAHRQLMSIVGKEFPITALFQYPTVASLAAYFGSIEAQNISGLAAARERAAKQRAAFARPVVARRRTA